MKRERESGFALLMVFLMAAGIAIMLYRQLPRTAFETMRGKEEMLMDRGEQYQRAVQLYVNKIKQYPQSIDDLEKMGGQRFLRRRYKDPFTGEDNWKILKVDANGVLTNSLIKKKEEAKPNTNTFITENVGLGGNPDQSGTGGVNVALRKRPSDGGPSDGGASPLPLPSPEFQPQTPVPDPLQNPGTQPQINPATGQPYPPGQAPNPQQQINPATGQPYPPGQAPNPQQQINPATGQPYPPGQAPNPQQQINPATGQPYPPGQAPNAQQQINPATGQPYPPGQAPNAQQQINPATGQPYPPGQAPNPQQQINPLTGQPYPPGQAPGQVPAAIQQVFPNGMPQYAAQINPQTGQPLQPGQQSSPGFGNPATGQPGGPTSTPNSAIDLIRGALTRPSPNIPTNLGPGLQLGGGVAGIASKYEGPSIKIYEDQQEYHKWEFIYDPKKDKRLQAALGTAQQPGNPSPNNPGGTNPSGQSPFGSNPSGQPPFGSNPSGPSPFGGGGPSSSFPPSGNAPSTGFPTQGNPQNRFPQPGFPQPGLPQPGSPQPRR